ncbi:hypothetical protein LIER_20943 [Lithospermum erythrorhizon]|uniref:Uncharacterized protein n=1 Tax=Lithospermum erythrorhizon TaxID=34254 RepID=A0AAV3QR71_LITER
MVLRDVVYHMPICFQEARDFGQCVAELHGYSFALEHIFIETVAFQSLILFLFICDNIMVVLPFIVSVQSRPLCLSTEGVGPWPRVNELEKHCKSFWDSISRSYSTQSQISEEIMTFNFSSVFGVQCCFFFVTQSKDMDVNPYSVILGENTKNSCAIESWWSLKPMEIGLGQPFSILLTFIYFNIKKNLSYIMS